MKSSNKNKVNVLILIAFMLIMVGLGISDSSRGVFSTIFEKDLALSKPQVSMIVTISYIGNLLFVLAGGRAADRFDRKKVFLTVLCIWTAAQIMFAATDNYVCLLIGMFFSMGASTLLNTLMNLLSPLLFGTMAGMFVNILFFVQGIGTSGNQKITGSLATEYTDFRFLCLGLAAIGLIGFLLLATRKFPKDAATNEKEISDNANDRSGALKEVTGNVNAISQETEKATVSYKMVIIMSFIFGFYFIAEHGIMNWWSMYCQQGLNMSSSQASTCISLFFGTMTIGRVVLSPLVQKLGSRKSIILFGGIGSILYIIGILLGIKGSLILGFSGIFISIIYPTCVLFLQEIFPKNCVATATGMVLSFGTVFDIAFNAVFGNLVEMTGFGICSVIFPVAMVLFYGGFLLLKRSRA